MGFLDGSLLSGISLTIPVLGPHMWKPWIVATSPASVHLFSSPFCFLSQLLPPKSVLTESGSALHLILVTVYNVFMLGFRMASFINFKTAQH